VWFCVKALSTIVNERVNGAPVVVGAILSGGLVNRAPTPGVFPTPGVAPTNCGSTIKGKITRIERKGMVVLYLLLQGVSKNYDR
jgi:hypothetical protein